MEGGEEERSRERGGGREGEKGGDISSIRVFSP